MKIFFAAGEDRNGHVPSMDPASGDTRGPNLRRCCVRKKGKLSNPWVLEYAGASQLADAGWPSHVLHLCPAELMPGPADSKHQCRHLLSVPSKPRSRAGPRGGRAGGV